MKCTNCGAELRPGVKFCTNCGAPRLAPPPAAGLPERPQARTAYRPAVALPTPAAPKTKRGWFWVALAVGALLIVLCVGAGALYLFKPLGPLRIGEPVVEPAVTERIGSEGGEIVGPGGVRVIVPKGALNEETEIRIAQAPTTPEIPANMVPASPIYEVTIPEGTEPLIPVEVVIPLERQAGFSDGAYAAYLWEGTEWHFLGGYEEGDSIHVQMSHFSYIGALARPVPVD